MPPTRNTAFARRSSTPRRQDDPYRIKWRSERDAPSFYDTDGFEETFWRRGELPDLEAEARAARLLSLLAMLGAWVLLSHALAGVAVATKRPDLFGKSAEDGSQSPWHRFLFLPYELLAKLRLYWQNSISSGESEYAEVAPNVFLGRRPRKVDDLPEDCAMVVDLTAERRCPPAVVRGRLYRCMPMLDSTVPGKRAFLRAVGEARDTLRAKRGAIYVYDIRGLTRGAGFVAAVLVSTGYALSIQDAEQFIREARPNVRIPPNMRRFLEASEVLFRDPRDRPTQETITVDSLVQGRALPRYPRAAAHRGGGIEDDEEGGFGSSDDEDGGEDRGFSRQSSLRAPNMPGVRAPSRFFRLRGCFDREHEHALGWEREALHDVRAACTCMGEVDEAHLDKECDLGTVYVLFREAQAAEKAMERMQGRWFAGAELECAFLEEAEWREAVVPLTAKREPMPWEDSRLERAQWMPDHLRQLKAGHERDQAARAAGLEDKISRVAALERELHMLKSEVEWTEGEQSDWGGEGAEGMRRAPSSGAAGGRVEALASAGEGGPAPGSPGAHWNSAAFDPVAPAEDSAGPAGSELTS